MDTTGEKEKRTSKKNVDGRSISSHDNQISGETQGNGIWFPEDVIKLDGWTDGRTDTDRQTVRQAGRQAGRQTGRQRDREIDR